MWLSCVLKLAYKLTCNTQESHTGAVGAIPQYQNGVMLNVCCSQRLPLWNLTMIIWIRNCDREPPMTLCWVVNVLLYFTFGSRILLKSLRTDENAPSPSNSGCFLLFSRWSLQKLPLCCACKWKRWDPSAEHFPDVKSDICRVHPTSATNAWTFTRRGFLEFIYDISIPCVETLRFQFWSDAAAMLNWVQHSARGLSVSSEFKTNTIILPHARTHTNTRTQTHANEVPLQIAVWLAKTCGMTPYKCVFRRRAIRGHCILVVVIVVSPECESMKTMLLLIVEQNATVAPQSFRGALIHFVLWRISAVFWSMSCLRAAPTVVTQLYFLGLFTVME